jgi:ribonucleotide monophosphatase NagD (HAD superfamily)
MNNDSTLARLLEDSIQAILLDLDGTIYHEDHALPGALEFITALERRGLRYACLTNSGSSPQRVQQRLASMRINIDQDHIYTAGAAAADYVMDRYGSEPRIFNLGTRGVQEMLQERATFVEDVNSPCDVVIAGDVNNSYATPPRQQMALHFLRKGAALVGICADRCYPSPRGIEIGGGAFCAMLGYAANITPVFAGTARERKPAAVCRQRQA